MNVLLLCPQFHGYYNEIIKAAKLQGHEVTFYPLDGYDHFRFEKIISKICRKIIYNKFDKYIEKIIETESSNKIDAIVVIYGGLYFRKKNVIQLKKQFKEAKFIYYNWDSVGNYNNASDYYYCFDYYYSFDLFDCKKYGFKHLPLFYSFDYETKNEKTSYDYGVLMSLGIKKIDGYNKVKNSLVGYKGKEYLFMPGGKAQFLYRKFLNFFKFRNLSIKAIKFHPLSLFECDHFYNDCKAVIDIPLEGQRGLTIRTFEILKKEKKLITTNKYIKEYSFYTPNNIFVVDNEHSKVPKSFFETPFDKQFSITKDYSVESFVLKLLKIS